MARNAGEEINWMPRSERKRLLHAHRARLQMELPLLDTSSRAPVGRAGLAATSGRRHEYPAAEAAALCWEPRTE